MLITVSTSIISEAAKIILGIHWEETTMLLIPGISTDTKLIFLRISYDEST
jgi:hypothetical protein